jgi:hypothetical protein
MTFSILKGFFSTFSAVQKLNQNGAFLIAFAGIIYDA